MTADHRALIRHLYFVDRVPLAVIAEELALAPQAVRRALVIADEHAPEPPEPPTAAPARPGRRPKKGP